VKANKYEKILMRDSFIKRGVMSAEEFISAIEKNEEALDKANGNNGNSRSRSKRKSLK
jgi:hypothetical protein